MKQNDHNEIDKLLDDIPNATSPSAGDHSGHLLSSSSSSSSSSNISSTSEELHGAQYRAEQQRLMLQQLALAEEFEAMHVGNRKQPAVSRPLINPQAQSAAARSPTADWSLNRRFEDTREFCLRRPEALRSYSNGVPAASGSQRLRANGCSGLNQCNSGVWDKDFVSQASSLGFQDQDFVSQARSQSLADAYMQAWIRADAGEYSGLEAMSRRTGTLVGNHYFQPARTANFNAGALGHPCSLSRNATDTGAMGHHYSSHLNSDAGAMGH